MHGAAQFNQANVIKYYLESNKVTEKNPQQNYQVEIVLYKATPLHLAATRLINSKYGVLGPSFQN